MPARVDLVGSLGIRDASGLADSDAVQNVVRSHEVRVLRLPPEVTVTGTVLPVVEGVEDAVIVVADDADVMKGLPA